MGLWKISLVPKRSSKIMKFVVCRAELKALFCIRDFQGILEHFAEFGSYVT